MAKNTTVKLVYPPKLEKLELMNQGRLFLVQMPTFENIVDMAKSDALFSQLAVLAEKIAPKSKDNVWSHLVTLPDGTGIFSYSSESAEETNTHVFEELRPNEERDMLLFHWRHKADSLDRNEEHKDLTMESISDDKFYACDDITSWASPWLEGGECYELEVKIKNPLIIVPDKDMKPKEVGYEFKYRTYLKTAKDLGCDCIVFIPDQHPDNLKLGMVRQIRLLKPKEQVKSIKRIV